MPEAPAPTLAPAVLFERPRELSRDTARHACARCRGLLLAEVRVGDLCAGCGAELEVVRARPGIVRNPAPRPEWQETLSLYGGLNLYGDPLVRVVWSEAASFISGGEWFERSIAIFDDLKPGEEHPALLGFHWLDEFDVYPEEKTYYRWLVKDKRVKVHDDIRERWVIEIWKPWTWYGSPETWEGEHLDPFTGKLLLGPWPERGLYVHYWTCQTKDGRFLTPTREILRHLCIKVRAERDLKERPQLKASIQKERRRRKEAREYQRDSDLVDAMKPAFNLTPHVSMCGQKSKGRKAHLL